MLGSLPGKYLGRYVRSVLLGGAAVGLSLLVLYGGLLGWGPILLVPGLIILGALGPGALALAATRAGMVARDRWRLLLLAMPLPIIAGIFASIGLAPQPIWVPFVVAAMLPLGVAWIAIGARISRGSTIGTAGGI